MGFFKQPEKKKTRFVTILEEYTDGSKMMFIFVDTHTGIQYVFARAGGDSGGMTVLLDENGKPLLNEEYRKK